jgi:hypothetical protein
MPALGKKKKSVKKHAIAQKKQSIHVEFRQEMELSFSSTKEAARFCKNPKATLNFRIGECSDKNRTLHVSPVEKFPMSLGADDIDVERSGKSVRAKFHRIFDVEIDRKKSKEGFNEWAYELGGTYCFQVELDDYEVEFGEGNSYLGTNNAYGMDLDLFF